MLDFVLDGLRTTTHALGVWYVRFSGPLFFSGLTVHMPLYGPRNVAQHVFGQDFLNHAQSLADRAHLNDPPLIVMAGLENIAWTWARRHHMARRFYPPEKYILIN